MLVYYIFCNGESSNIYSHTEDGRQRQEGIRDSLANMAVALPPARTRRVPPQAAQAVREDSLAYHPNPAPQATKAGSNSPRRSPRWPARASPVARPAKRGAMRTLTSPPPRCSRARLAALSVRWATATQAAHVQWPTASFTSQARVFAPIAPPPRVSRVCWPKLYKAAR